MRLKKEISILVDRILLNSEVSGPFIELPLYLNDNGDFTNKNPVPMKPELYKNIDIINNYEIFELLDYMKRKGIIKDIKDILAYKEHTSKEFDMLTKMELRKRNTANSVYKKYTVLVETCKFDMLEYLENTSVVHLSSDIK